MEGKWRIEMLGHLALRSGSVVHTRFYSHKVAYLLAWLAYHPNRQFSRDELIEILWPDGALRSGRASLRQALSMLRRHLEPQGVPFGSVLLANYAHVGLNPETLATDVAEFEAALYRAADSAEPEMCFALVKAAVGLYTGDLLPGFYEDWAVRERERLIQRARDAINRLAALAEQRGDRATGLDCAWRLVGMDPADEEANLTLIRLLVETGQHSLARTRYALFWDAFADLYGEPPSEEIHARLRAWNVLPPDRHAINPSRRTAPRQLRAGANPLSPVAPCSDFPTPARPPLMLTPTFGRDEEIRLLCDTLRRSEVRLLTVTGLGGIGKTRVALETASALDSPGVRCSSRWRR